MLETKGAGAMTCHFSWKGYVSNHALQGIASKILSWALAGSFETDLVPMTKTILQTAVACLPIIDMYHKYILLIRIGKGHYRNRQTLGHVKGAYIHTYMHVYNIHTCINTYIHTYIHTYTHTFMYTFIHTYMLWIYPSIHPSM